MAIDYNLILGGQSPDIVGAMSRGNALAGQVMQQDQARQTRDLYQTQGAGISQGDPNALNALAGIDPATAMDLRAAKQRMDIMSAAERRAIQEFSAKASADQKAAAVKQIEDAVKMGTAIQDPQTWDQVMSQQAPELVGQFEMRDALARKYMTMAEAIKAGQGSDDSQNPYEQRKRMAADLGMSISDPVTQNLILTGKLPQSGGGVELTAIDKKAILEADEMVMANTATIDLLNQVIKQDENGLSINDRAGYGATAGAQAFIARNDPTGIFDDEKGQATTELQNIVLNQGLAQLKSIFGAAPTEGERKILIELQASIDKTPAERKLIVERAIAAAKNRLAFNKQRADQLRQGTFYGPQGGGQNQTQNGGIPAGVDPEIWEEMTPEERAEFQ